MTQYVLRKEEAAPESTLTRMYEKKLQNFRGASSPLKSLKNGGCILFSL
jgi:hypothetical protein